MDAQDLAHQVWQPVDPPQQPVLFVNPRSGDGTSSRGSPSPSGRGPWGSRSSSSSRATAMRGQVQAAVGSGADALGMAGGDGSLAAVATAAIAHDLPSSGPGRHAKPLRARPRGGPKGRPRCLDAFGQAVERRIDVGVVNGRPSSTTCRSGSTARPCTRRPTATPRCTPSRRPRRRCSAPLARRRLCGSSTGRTRASAARSRACVEQPLFAGSAALGHPPNLDSGRLGIIVLDAESPAPPGHAWSAPYLEVLAPSPVHAGIDGEAAELCASAALRDPTESAARAECEPDPASRRPQARGQPGPRLGTPPALPHPSRDRVIGG